VQNFWDLGLKEEIRLGSHVIQAAIHAGNHPHIVYSSGLGAEKHQNVAAIDGKAILEEKLRNSGLPFTILRPGLFMDDFLGASLPFARPIQKLLDAHRPLVGRLFLATLQAVMPKDSRIPLTTLRDVGRVAAWALGNPEESKGQVFEVIGSLETGDALSELWTRTIKQSIPYVPLLAVGLRLAHRRMATLLEWLGQRQFTISNAPVPLQTYEEWLSSFP
ncbi:MAG: NmrA family NAD(P)-binding protein, partial [Thermaerobacter sp.]|nr:NmrA family NAD(P)-binding protein [Thermaerobacter sp.]